MIISPSSRLVLISVAVAATLLVGAGGMPAATSQGAATTAPSAEPTQGVVSTPDQSQRADAATAEPTLVVSPPQQPEPSPTSVADGTETLASLVASLTVADEHRDGYQRDLFRLWIDANGNGCDTRKEVLIDEALVPPQIGSGCRLAGGKWRSPYDGVTVTDSSKLDIDHLVPLAEAWDSGAYAWTAGRREAYANDLSVPWALIAVTASLNRSKGDRDPGEWMPPLASDRCTYTVDWVAVKVRWRLTIDPAEQHKLQELASACWQTPIPVIPSASVAP